VFEDLLAYLAHAGRAVALDLRGHGDSDWDAAGRYRLADYERDTTLVAGTLGLERPILIGHSLGAAVALRLAITGPPPRALVLLDAGVEVEASAVRLMRAGHRARPRACATVGEFRTWLAMQFRMAPAHTLDRMALRGLRRRPDGAFVPKTDPQVLERSQSPAPARSPIGWGDLARVDVPCLVVRGAASALLTPRVARRMGEVLPKGRVTEIPKAGHAVLVDNPAAVASAIDAFLVREVYATRSG
jgi:pimeloyl-ACP methyl ester carboxylesterase